jgi:hypothetical protein
MTSIAVLAGVTGCVLAAAPAPALPFPLDPPGAPAAAAGVVVVAGCVDCCGAAGEALTLVPDTAEAELVALFAAGAEVFAAGVLAGGGATVLVAGAGGVVIVTGGGACDLLATALALALGLALALALVLATGLGLALALGEAATLALALALGVGVPPPLTLSKVASTTSPAPFIFRCTGLGWFSSCWQPRFT